MNWVGIGGVAGVDQVDEETRALDVLEESDAEAGAFMRTFDEAGEIGDNKSAAEFCTVTAGSAVGIHDSKIWFERREGIVRDFGARSRDDRNQRGFSGIGETDEADISEKS